MTSFRNRAEHNRRFQLTAFFAVFIFLILLGCISLMYQFPDRDRAVSSYLIEECKNFKIAEQIAEQDLRIGKSQIVLGGNRYDSDRMFLLDSILRFEFKIEVYRAGCEGPTEEVERYNDVMITHFKKIYGDHFFLNALNKVERIIRERRAKASST